jgi:hypothetical protein
VVELLTRWKAGADVDARGPDDLCYAAQRCGAVGGVSQA